MTERQFGVWLNPLWEMYPAPKSQMEEPEE